MTFQLDRRTLDGPEIILFQNQKSVLVLVLLSLGIVIKVQVFRGLKRLQWSLVKK